MEEDTEILSPVLSDMDLGKIWRNTMRVSWSGTSCQAMMSAYYPLCDRRGCSVLRSSFSRTLSMSGTLAGATETTLQPCSTTSTTYLCCSSLTSCLSRAIGVLQLSIIYCDGWITQIDKYEGRTWSICLAMGASHTTLQLPSKYDIGLRGLRYIKQPSNPIGPVQSST